MRSVFALGSIVGLAIPTACDSTSQPNTGTINACSGEQYRANGRCQPLTVCTASEYQTRYPTATSDRACAPLTVCRANEYERRAPTATSDRICRRLTACKANEFETQAPTTTSDRMCRRVRTCDANEYEAVAPTATSDRRCEAITRCRSGQYEAEPPTATSDRVCLPINECPDGHYQHVPAGDTWDTVCLPVTVCGASEYVAVEASAVSDRECAPITNCTVREYELEPPTETSDRRCSPLTVCTDEEFELSSPSRTEDRVCAELTVCAAGQYESVAPTSNSDRACAPLTECAEGEYVKVEPTATSDRVCGPYVCNDRYPTDHEGLQAVLDDARPGSTIRVTGTCRFDPPPGSSRAPGSVSILKDGITITGPAVIKGGYQPVQIGSQSPYGKLAFCSDRDATCVKVFGVTVRELEFVSPINEAIRLNASRGGIVIEKNLVHPPRMVEVDFERLFGVPFVEPQSGCITIAPGMNSAPPDLVVGPDLITGDILVSHNICIGGAELGDETDPFAVPFQPGPDQPVVWLKGAWRGIGATNCNATVRIEGNYVENVFSFPLMANGDSPLFVPRASAMRVEFHRNTIVQDAPDIVLGGFLPFGIHARLDPNINFGPHAINENEIFIEDNVVGIGVGIDIRGLVNFEANNNEVEIRGAGLGPTAIGLIPSRQGPTGPGRVEGNTIRGNTDVGIFVAVTQGVSFVRNNVLATTTLDAVFAPPTQNNVYRGNGDDVVLDCGNNNDLSGTSPSPISCEEAFPP